MSFHRRSLTGLRFGKLLVLEQAPNRSKHRAWKCVCDCGKEKVLTTEQFYQGTVKSCGCLRFKHGLRNTASYDIWCNMIRRCDNPEAEEYPNYGGRGIKVCDRWRGDSGMQNFYEDMGERPTGLSLDRIDNDGPYSPENCRWATIKQQSMNKRNTRLVTYRGETKPLMEWASIVGIRYIRLIHRLRKNWTVERAFETPVKSS